MPSSTRAEDQHGATLGNKLTTLFVDLPIEPMEPEGRLRLVHERTEELKRSHQGEAASALIDAAMWAPPALHREAARFGNANSQWRRFDRWAQKGRWDPILAPLRRRHPPTI